VIGGGGTSSSGDAAEASAAEGATARETADPAAAQTTDGPASGAGAEQTAASGSGAGATSDTGSRGFRPGGGWTISVASRTDRAAAESLVDRYREQVGNDLPVDIVEATVNGEPRYRVGVGQFASRSAARDAMETYGETIPSGAWPIQIP
jgi:septal ring-binding cell division protein DamX